jgi:hypothetical protein
MGFDVPVDNDEVRGRTDLFGPFIRASDARILLNSSAGVTELLIEAPVFSLPAKVRENMLTVRANTASEMIKYFIYISSLRIIMNVD